MKNILVLSLLAIVAIFGILVGFTSTAYLIVCNMGILSIAYLLLIKHAPNSVFRLHAFRLVSILLVIGIAIMIVLSILLCDRVNQDLKPLFYSVVFANILQFGNLNIFSPNKNAQKHE